jgi:hypothetical protein
MACYLRNSGHTDAMDITIYRWCAWESSGKDYDAMASNYDPIRPIAQSAPKRLDYLTLSADNS